MSRPPSSPPTPEPPTRSRRSPIPKSLGGWIEELAALRPDLELDPEVALLSTWHDDPWVRGSYSARSVSSPLRDAELSTPLGPLFFAGEHTAGDWHGLMEGALRSGERAARQLLEAGFR